MKKKIISIIFCVLPLSMAFADENSYLFVDLIYYISFDILVFLSVMVFIICGTICLCKTYATRKKESLLKEFFSEKIKNLNIENISPEIKNQQTEEQKDSVEKLNKTDSEYECLSLEKYSDIMKAYLNAISEL